VAIPHAAQEVENRIL